MICNDMICYDEAWNGMRWDPMRCNVMRCDRMIRFDMIYYIRYELLGRCIYMLLFDMLSYAMTWYDGLVRRRHEMRWDVIV